MSEPWVSVEELSRHLGAGKDRIYRWIEPRAVPAHRVGRLSKFKTDESDEWVRRGGAGDRNPSKRADDDAR
ncbi:excisionase family DNA-binding protein [Sorangium sp. wiwo2]|uniref:Excisionase family DNA-binding protein n=2 Tax=Sorangium atrum TaxID=2995308 RepID=A0ABT5C871_9BACT|nr:excisionase family DNA-binding protein [Sorangium aterium]